MITPEARFGFYLLPYSTKRHGLTLVNCDSEPVQTPGCVQAIRRNINFLFHINWLCCTLARLDL